MMTTIFVKISLLTILFVFLNCAVTSSADNEGRQKTNVKKTIQQADGCKCDGGTCVKDRSGKLVCMCPPEYGVYKGWSSLYCKKCDCGKGVNCTFTGFLNSKTCICKDGYVYVSNKCKDLCTENPCKNGGICQMESGQVKCYCKSPFTGEFCENDISSTSMTTENGTRISLPTTITVFNDSSSETDDTAIDATTSNDHHDHLLTNVTVPTNTNSAITETTTMAATTLSDLCTENPCKNGGICQMESRQVKCYCKSPFTGEFCENDPCTINLCRNGGTCLVQNTTFYCNCDVPFFGEFCERDPCSENPCQNGGSCFIRRNTFICDCKKPYIGNICEIGKILQTVLS